MKFLFHNRRNFLLLCILVLSNGMVFLDATILPVALPEIQKTFHSTSAQAQWMVNSYLLAMAVLMVACGKLADLLGRRKIFCIGMGLFGISSLFCGLSHVSWHLIGLRFIQGIGSAMMIPSSTGLLCEAFSEKERYTVIGILASVGSIFITLGPLIGGYFTEYLTWHYIFFINVPISVIAITFTLIVITKSPKIKESIDIYGFLFFGLGFFCLTLALMQMRNWKILIIIALFLLMLLSFFLLYLFYKRAKVPFIDFTLFKIPLFLFPLIIYTGIFIARMITVFWAIYFQNVLGFSPFFAGAIVATSVCPMIFLSPFIGFFVNKFGTKKPVIFGQFLLIFSYAWLAIFTIEGNLYILMPGLLLCGVGMVLVANISYSVAINAVSVAKSTLASSIITTCRNAGSCLGVAILGSVLTNVQFGDFSSALSKIAPKANPSLFEALLSGSSKAIEALKAFPQNTQIQIKEALSFSYSLGITVANITAGIIIIIGFFTIFTLRKIRLKKEKMIPPTEP